MPAKKLSQKLVTFTDHGPEFELVKTELTKGWSIVSMVTNGNNYYCIMEKQQANDNEEEGKVYIPPRKKIKIHAK